jgi:hypothetical protein
MMRARPVLLMTLVAAAAVALVTGAPVASSPRVRTVTVLPGRWDLPASLSTAPAAIEGTPLSVWTGRSMIIFGRHHLAPSARFADIGRNVNVALAYDPGSNRWRQLDPPAGPTGAYEGHDSLLWTGKEVLAWGGPDISAAYNPGTNRWRKIPSPPRTAAFGNLGGIVVWSGREMISVGGGCCGDASKAAAAYAPASDSWRALPRSPLAAAQRPTGAWDGHEVLLFLGPTDVNGKPLAASRRAAAYNPATNRWRRIAPMPSGSNLATGSAVWDGHELLVVGGTGTGTQRLARVGLAYAPATNRWRRLPAMPSGRSQAAAVWTGARLHRLLLWGGTTPPTNPPPGEGLRVNVIPPHGLAYDPTTNRWAALPPAPAPPAAG